jgi:mono/diheme cytochrome c family protein
MSRNQLQHAIASLMILSTAILVGSGRDAAAIDAKDKAQTAQSGSNPFAGDRNAITEGADIFGRNCQQCHSTRGIGGKCPQLIHGAWAPDGANSDEFMFRTIKKGRPNTQMGAWEGGLTDDEIWKIVTYLRYEARVYQEQQKTKSDDDDDTRR